MDLHQTAFSDWKDVAAIISSIVTAGAIISGLGWFLFTRSFRRRIQFEVDLQLIDLRPEATGYLAEVMLIIENKGPREHRIYNLFCEVRQPRHLASADGIRAFFPLRNLVPEDVEYFFVQAGVRQTFTRAFLIPSTEKAVRVMAVFTYEQRRIDISSLKHLDYEALDGLSYQTHSVSKLFKVAPKGFGP